MMMGAGVAGGVALAGGVDTFRPPSVQRDDAQNELLGVAMLAGLLSSAMVYGALKLKGREVEKQLLAAMDEGVV
jgi:hypothetical protein